MIIRARINGNDNYIYKLCEWNSSLFADSPVLKLQTDDLVGVKEVFNNITKIEIYQAEVLTSEYTLYDTYSSICYNGRVFVHHEGIFADCLEVRLQKSSLADQVRRIEEAISNDIDIDAMTVAEYKSFVLNNILRAEGKAKLAIVSQIFMKELLSKSMVFSIISLSRQKIKSIFYSFIL